MLTQIPGYRLELSGLPPGYSRRVTHAFTSSSPTLTCPRLGVNDPYGTFQKNVTTLCGFHPNVCLFLAGRYAASVQTLFEFETSPAKDRLELRTPVPVGQSTQQAIAERIVGDRLSSDLEVSTRSLSRVGFSFNPQVDQVLLMTCSSLTS